MNSQLFPVIFGRIASAPLSLLDQLIWKERDLYLTTLNQTVKEVDSAKNLLIVNLFELIDNNKDHPAYFQLINLKRAVFNNKLLAESAFLLVEFPCLHHPVNRYLLAMKEKHSAMENFKCSFENSIAESTTIVSQLSDAHFLRNGLIFSSEILLRSLTKPVNKQLGVTKKERRKTLAILKYLTRSICKTTPFSSFNEVVGFQHAGAHFSPIADGFKKSNFQISGLFFYYLKELLLREQSLINTLNVRVNQSLWKEENDSEGLHFFINKNNNEAFKRITHTDLLKDIIKKTTEAQPYFTLITGMQEAYEENVDTVRALVDHLISEGLLVLTYPVSNNDLKWISTLKRHIEKITEPNVMLSQVNDLLDKIMQTIHKLEANTVVAQRLELMEECINFCRKLFDLNASDFSKKVKMQDLFYEDTLNAPKEKIAVNDVAALGATIQNALKRLEKLSIKSLFKAQLTKISGLTDGQKIPILSFYHKIYLSNRELVVKEEQMEPINSVLNQVYQHMENAKNESEPLDLSLFFNDPNTATSPNKPVGVYLQCADFKFNKIVINSLSMGYGANISRFLNFLPTDFASQVRQFNKEVLDNCVVAEVKDASIHNTNTFPQLADHLISLQQDQSFDTFDEIQLKDIFVTVSNGDLSLTNEEGIEIKALNFSLEGLNRKAKFVQFLDIFSADLSSHTHVISSINSHFEKKMTVTDLVAIPEIVFGNTLILQRRKWLINKAFITAEIVDTTLHQTYLNAIAFLNRFNIPAEVFVKIKKKDSLNSEDDNYKPQYMNFKSPLFIQLLITLLRNADQVIEIVDMYPNSAQVKNGDGYVKEFILNLV